MSTNSCQYDLNQWSRILLDVRPFLQQPPHHGRAAFPRHNLQRCDPPWDARSIDPIESAMRAQRSVSSELTFPPSRGSFSSAGKSFSQTAKCAGVLLPLNP